MNEILKGLDELRRGFLKSGLKAPTVILLESREQGMRFLMTVADVKYWVETGGPRQPAKPVEMADGSVWMECTIMNMVVRWPANTIATPDGSGSFV